jgi:hypothetical protein
MSETNHAACGRTRACRRKTVASLIVLVVMAVPLNAKACDDHAAPRGQSIDEGAPDPFRKRFPPPRAANPRDQILVDQADRSMSRSVFELPGLMSDTQRADPRRTGRLEWMSPLPSPPDEFGRRLRERDGDPATR